MKADFIHFSEIDVEDPATWQGRNILSLDIDWASDEVLHYTLDIIEAHPVKCCLFVTHETAVLERARKNPLFELGIHPNFNPLLNKSDGPSAEQTIVDLLKIVPEARVFRSHSLTTSGVLLPLYKKYGAKYLSNYMMNGVENIVPFYQVNGLIEAPIYYADDGELFLRSNPEIPHLPARAQRTAHRGLRVFNFHPIHIALNCMSFEQYAQAKSEVLTTGQMKQYAAERNGITNTLLQLIS
jgi:hypothetical protein